MGEKEGGDQKKKGDGGKKEEGPITVFEVDMHCNCEGCAEKVKSAVRAVRRVDGVQDANVDSSNKKLTVVGKVNPEKIRETIEYKTGKKAVLVSPLPKKHKEDVKEKKAVVKKSKERAVEIVQPKRADGGGDKNGKGGGGGGMQDKKRGGGGGGEGKGVLVQPNKVDGGGDRKGKGGRGGDEKKDKKEVHLNINNYVHISKAVVILPHK